MRTCLWHHIINMLTHYRMMTLSFKFHIVNFDYFKPIDAIKLTIEVLIKPRTNREAVGVWLSSVA